MSANYPCNRVPSPRWLLWTHPVWLSVGLPTLVSSGFLSSCCCFWNVPCVHISACVFFFSHDVPSAWNDLPSWSSWEFSPFFWNNLSSFAPPLGRGLWPPEALPSLCSPGTSLLAALHMAILQGLFHRCDFLLTWLFCFIIISPKRQALYFTHLVFSKL